MSLWDNIKAIAQRDSACSGPWEVVLAYNGFHILLFHKLAHFLYQRKWRIPARIVSNTGRWLTGIEIHPGAQIGERLFIDHGTGLVIGETAIIGNDVNLYHGVTLGGVGREGKDGKRHPTIKDGAMVGAGAQVLGDITIGENAKVGANSVVLNDIPEGATAIGIPARVVGGDDKRRSYGLPSSKEMEDITFTIDCIIREMGEVKEKIAKDEKAQSKTKKLKKAGEYLTSP